MRRLLAVVLSLLPALAFGAASDAQPVPIKNTAQRVTFPILDADGDLVTGAASLDSECSCDGGTFADCTNEATEIATSSGIYYLDLSSGEANCATLAVIVKTGTAGAKTTPLVVYPATATGEQIPVDAQKWDGAATATDDIALLASLGAAHIDADAIGASEIAADAIGASELATDSIGAAEIAADAMGASEVAADAIGASEVAVGAIAADAFAAGAIDAAAIAADAIGASEIASAAIAADEIAADAIGASEIAADAIGASEVAVGAVAADAFAAGAIDSSAIAADAIGASELAVGAVAADAFAAGAIDASAIATDAIGAAEIAAGAIALGTEATGWDDLDAAGVRSAVGLASANLDTQLSALQADSDLYDTDAEHAAALWNAATATYGSAGSYGLLLETNLDATVSSRGTGAALDAAGVRSAVGLASANLDTQLSAIDDYVDTEVAAILADTAAMDTADEMQTLVWDSTTVRALTELDEDNTTIDLNASTIGTVTTLTGHTAQTGDSFARLGAPAGANVSADIAAIKAETASILSDTNLYDTDAEHATAIWNAATATYGSAGSYGEALEAVGAAPSAATIADAVWDEAISGHLGAGSTGAALNAAGSAGDPWSTPIPGAYGAGTAGYIVGNNLNATVGSRSSHSAADVWAAGTRTLTALDEDSTTLDLNATTIGTVTTLTGHTPQTGDSFARLGAPAGASVSADVAAVKAETASILTDTGAYDTDAEHAAAIWNAATATYGSAGSYGEAVESVSSSAIADAVWDEALSGHLSAGSTGLALNSAGSAGDPWSTALPGAYSTNTAGWIIGTKLNAATVTTTSPVSSSGQAVSIIKGDDYYNADGRALTFTASSWSLTGSTVKLYLKRNGVTALTVTGTVSSATVCYFELTRTQTAALSEGTYQLAVQEIEAGVSAHVGTLLLESTATVYATPNP